MISDKRNTLRKAFQNATLSTTNLIRTGLESNPALIKVYNVCNVQLSKAGNRGRTVNTSLADRGVGFNELPYASR